jgi:hypothetical protein
MSRINGFTNANAIQRNVNAVESRTVSAESEQVASSADRVELSGSPYPASAQDGVRIDLVASIRKQIEAGTYETEDKVDVSVDRLMKDLGV